MLVIYNDLNTWFRIDKEHRKYYMTFIINATLCVITIVVIVYKGLWIDYLLSLAVTDILMIDTLVRKIMMIKDLKNKKLQKSWQNKK